jgi:putative membrane protein
VTGLLLLAVIIGALVLLARDDEPPSPDVPAQSADEVLDERLARGDITPEEYRQRAAALHAVRPRPTSRI